MSAAIFEELLALCENSAYDRMRQVLTREQLSDGKTLLHLAVAKRNLSIVRLLVEAGAKLTVADKKGVRVADTTTWTEVVYPAVACPLQNAVFKLEQRSGALDVETRLVNGAVAKTLDAADQVHVENENALHDLDASRRATRRVLGQIEHMQHAVADTNAQIAAQGPRREAIDAEIQRAKAKTLATMEQIEATKTETLRLRKASEQLRQRHAAQRADLAMATNQCAVKCESVQTVERFALDEGIQQRFVRAVVVMGHRVDVVQKLAMGCVQVRVMDAITRHGHNASIVCDGISLIVLLLDMKRKYPQDPVLTTYLQPWSAETLIHSLENAVGRQTSEEDTARVLNACVQLLQRLQHAHDQTDRSPYELEQLVRAAATRIMNFSCFSQLEQLSDVRAAIIRLAG